MQRIKNYVEMNKKDARFATEEEIRHKYAEIDFSKKQDSGGLVIISDGKTGVVDNLDSSTMVVGSTGSTKTQRVVIPYVVSSILAGNSMIIHDPKLDIYKHSFRLLKKNGYKIIVLNYRNPQCGDRYNPLEYAAMLYKKGNTDKAVELIASYANTLFTSVKSDEDPFWHLAAANYFCGLAELACRIMPAEEVTLDLIYDLHLQGDEKFGGSTFMKEYFKDSELGTLNCWKRIYPQATAPNETRTSINSVFTTCLDTYIMNEGIIDLTKHSSFQVEDIVKRKTAVFFVTRDETSIYNGLVSASLDVFYTILIDCAEKSGGSLKRRVDFVLDEFGNLAQMKNIHTNVTICRARGIRYLLVCQSLSQLNIIYGKEIASIIVQNCNNLVYLYSPDIELNKKVSQMCGYRTDEITNQEIPLLTENELRTLDKNAGESLFLLDRMPAYISYLPFARDYGLTPVKKVNFKERRKQDKLFTVDFQRIVKERQKEKLLKMLEESREEAKKEIKRQEQRGKTEMIEDHNNTISIINAAINKKRGEDDEFNFIG